MVLLRSYKSLTNFYNRKSDDIKKYFQHLPKLLKTDYDACLSYQFSRVELAQNMTIRCGIVKLHKANAKLTDTAIQRWHRTRDDFIEKFKTVFNKAVPEHISQKLKKAEKTRDKVMHGKIVRDEEKRKAISEILDYAEEFNLFVSSIAGFRPFGNLRSFKGSRVPILDGSTTRWILKGMGFNID